MRPRFARGFLALGALGAIAQGAAGAPAGTRIENTARVAYTDASGNDVQRDSNLDLIVTTAGISTSATIELLRHAPGNPGAIPEDVGAGLCSSNGDASGSFGPAPPPQTRGGQAIDLGQPVALLPSGGPFTLGDPVFFRVVDRDQNGDPGVIESVEVELTTDAGDREVFRIPETGADTGEFIGYVATAAPPAVPGNCRLELDHGQSFQARYVDPDDGSDVAVVSSLIDPFGRVFDSATGAPIDGATVTLLDAATLLPATVLGDDGASAYPSSIVSGSTVIDGGGTSYVFPPGGFRFPQVAPGSYVLRVDPPPGFTHPSTVGDAQLQTLPGAPYALGPGSRGQPFDVLVGPAVEVDVPLDGSGAGSLLTKVASRDHLGIGEFLQYVVRLANPPGSLVLPAAVVVDNLPRGFVYEKGSARINGVAQEPAVDGTGRSLRFELGDVAGGGIVEIRYVARVTAAAKVGEAVNQAQLETAAGLTANVARAVVRVVEDLFSDRSFLVGRVMIGQCEDEVSDPHVGVPQVRILLENGSYAISDEEGRFHFAGVAPGNHVVQLDVDSLPPGFEPAPCPPMHRDAGRPFSQFVDVQAGTLWRTDFHVRPIEGSVQQRLSADPTPDGFGYRLELAVDGAALDDASAVVMLPEGERFEELPANDPETGLSVEAGDDHATFRFGSLEEGARRSVSFRTRGTAGEAPGARAIVRGRAPGGAGVTTAAAAAQAAPESAAIRPGGSDAPAEPVPAAPRRSASDPRPKDAFTGAWIETAEQGNAWLYPAEGFSPLIPSVDVGVKHDPSLTPRLVLNSQLVSGLLYEGRQQNAAGTVAVSRWRGVDLREGANSFSVVLSDASGEVVQVLERGVYYSGPPLRAEVVPESSMLVADGRTRPVVAVRFYDAKGRPVREGVSGSFRVDPPYQSAEEVQAQQERPLAGLGYHESSYVVGRDGIARIELYPTSVVGEARLHFPFARGHDQEVVAWLEPGDREWVLVSLADVRGGYSFDDGDNDARRADDQHDGAFAEGRFAFYAKGRVKGKWLLTASYDTDAPRTEVGERLFQTLDPDEEYTLYGDGTEQGYDAPTSDGLYLKVERERFYALYGDFDTGLDETELSRYSRAFTGAKSEYQGDHVEYEAFAAQSDQTFVKDEIQGKGVSGLYRLSSRDILIGSDRIAIETRDRFRSEIILSREELTRHIDYNIDYLDGTVYFRHPITSQDSNFNPIFIVAEYEVADGSSKDITGGGRVAGKVLDDRVEVGFTGIHEDGGQADGNLYGLDATVKLGEHTEARAELAHSDQDDPSSGSRDGEAWLVEVDHYRERLDAKAYYKEQEEGFGLGQQNAAEGATRKMGIDSRYQLTEQTRIEGTAFHQKVLDTDAERTVGSAVVAYDRSGFGASGGARVTHSQLDSDRGTGVQILGGARKNLFDDRLTLRTDGEVAVLEDPTGEFPHRLIAGADLKVTEPLTLFGEEELTWGKEQDTQETRVGFHLTPWNGTTLSSSVAQEVREAGPRTYANMGLQQHWSLSPEWGIDAAVDRVQTIRDPGNPTFDAAVPPASGAPPTVSPVGTTNGGLTDDFTAVSLGTAYRRDAWAATLRGEMRLGSNEDSWGVLFGAIRDHDEDTSYNTRLNFFLIDANEGTSETRIESRFGLAHRPLDPNWIVLERIDIDYVDLEGGGFDLETFLVMNHLKGNYQWDRRTQLSLQYSVKYVVDTFDGSQYESFGNLVGLEGRRDIDEHWDVGLHGRLLHSASLSGGLEDNGFDTCYGVSVGRTLFTNIWVSVGYNFDGFYDDEFSRGDYTAQGPYVAVRAKLDQKTIRDALERFTSR